MSAAAAAASGSFAAAASACATGTEQGVKSARRDERGGGRRVGQLGGGRDGGERLRDKRRRLRAHDTRRQPGLHLPHQAERAVFRKRGLVRRHGLDELGGAPGEVVLGEGAVRRGVLHVALCALRRVFRVLCFAACTNSKLSCHALCPAIACSGTLLRCLQQQQQQQQHGFVSRCAQEETENKDES